MIKLDFCFKKIHHDNNRHGKQTKLCVSVKRKPTTRVLKKSHLNPNPFGNQCHIIIKFGKYDYQ